MGSFSDYVNSNETEKISGNANKAMEILKNVSSRYEGASESEMLKAIISEAEKSRANGTLTDKDLDSFFNMLSPMLNSGQVKRLEKIIAKLKKGK